MKKKFDKGLIIFTTFTLVLDYFVYSGLKWISDHETCMIDGIKQICWGSSPTPVYAITFLAMALTLLATVMWVIWWLKNEQK